MYYVYCSLFYNIVVKCLISWPPKRRIKHKVANYWCASSKVDHFAMMFPYDPIDELMSREGTL